METINLETTRDEAFLREVEAESGQKVTNCYGYYYFPDESE